MKYNNNEDLIQTAETRKLNNSFDFLLSRYLVAQRSEAKSLRHNKKVKTALHKHNISGLQRKNAQAQNLQPE